MTSTDYRSTTACAWDFYTHAERRAGGVHPHQTEGKLAQAHFPAGTSLWEALQFMWEARDPVTGTRRMSKSSARAGCYEIQNDDGVATQVDGNRMDLSTAARAAKVTFKTWEELESEEICPVLAPFRTDTGILY